MGQKRQRDTQTQIDSDLEWLALVGSCARVLSLRYRSLTLMKLKDILYLWPSIRIYIQCVHKYRKIVHGMSLHQEIVRRVDGEAEAERFRTTWESQDSQAFGEIFCFGSLLCLGCGLWALDHLHTASRLDAPVSERNHSRDEILHATRTLSKRLREYRRQLQRAGEDLDIVALFEAWASAGPAVGSRAKALASRMAQRVRTEGIEPVLLELPFVPVGAIAKHAQSVLRSAYVAEAPHREAPPVTSLRSSSPEGDDETDDEFLGRKGALTPDFAYAVAGKIDRDREGDDLRRRVRSELTEKQQSTVMEYWEALSQGHTRSGKLGQSLRQCWGAGYGRRRRMLHRIRRDHPDIISKVEKLAL